MGVLPIQEAWTILGKDPRIILQRLAGLPRTQRVSAAEQDLEEAKKLAKRLRMAHHPDRGGDAELFKRVGDAISAIEFHTSEFKRKMKLAEEESEERSAGRVFIRLGE